tara:strand:- start:508 stop:1542 length:1035 start_codon:yes stop_codon:yes gene_type:complete
MTEETKIEKVTETELKLVFADVLRGYTKIDGEKLDSENDFYIKHLSIFDNIRTDQDYEEALKKAKKSDLPTEKKQLEYLNRDKIWTQEEESELAQLKSYISNLGETKSKMFLKSQIDVIKKDIDNASIKLLNLENQKAQYMGLTAEKYAMKKANETYIQQGVYKDQDFKELAVGDEEFNDLTDEKLSELTQAYNESSRNITLENLKKTALMPFFCNYYYLCDDNPQVFYGKPVVGLTFFQAELFAYGRYFKNLAQDSKASPPDEIRNDPDKLVEFYEMRKVADETMDKIDQKVGDKGGATSLVGATKEDLEAIGYKGGDTVSLSELAKKKGGSLSMDDFMEIHS